MNRQTVKCIATSNFHMTFFQGLSLSLCVVDKNHRFIISNTHRFTLSRKLKSFFCLFPELLLFSRGVRVDTVKKNSGIFACNEYVVGSMWVRLACWVTMTLEELLRAKSWQVESVRFVFIIMCANVQFGGWLSPLLVWIRLDFVQSLPLRVFSICIVYQHSTECQRNDFKSSLKKTHRERESEREYERKIETSSTWKISEDRKKNRWVCSVPWRRLRRQ